MEFDPSFTNVTELLIVALAIFAIAMLMRKKFDSNLPLLFFSVAVTFTNMADRPLNPFLLYGSMVFALLLRFEFMNTTFSKFAAFFAGIGLCGIIYAMVSDAFTS